MDSDTYTSKTKFSFSTDIKVKVETAIELEHEVKEEPSHNRPHDIINSVDYLLENNFSFMSAAQQKAVRDRGPHHPEVEIMQVHKNQKRRFNISWYEKKDWLTPSASKNSLFCFYCLLFGGEDAWTRQGVRDMKHLSERIKSHESSHCHIRNALRYALFHRTNMAHTCDTVHSIRNHNLFVDTNRRILSQVIDCIKFLAVHEISLEDECFVHEMLQQVASNDVLLQCHSDTVEKYVCPSIQHYLLNSMQDIYDEELKLRVMASSYLAVQVDEMTDISDTSQLVLILRYTFKAELRESVHGFVNVTDRSPSGIGGVILRELNVYQLSPEKLVSVSYDIAAVTNGSQEDVHNVVKARYPNAYFTHCYAHHIHSVVKNACSAVPLARQFFANISAFSSFFSGNRRRSDFINMRGSCVIDWTIPSQAVFSVIGNKEVLTDCFSHMMADYGWDDITIHGASDLGKLLEDYNFLFFLDFFSRIFSRVEILDNYVQANAIGHGGTHNNLHQLRSLIEEMRDILYLDSITSKPEPSRKRRRFEDMQTCVSECGDAISREILARFQDKDHLRCFSLMNPTFFREFEISFPEAKFAAINAYPFLQDEILRNELRVLYSSVEFQELRTIGALHSFLVNNELTSIFPESVKLINVILTVPVVTNDDDRRFDTLQRIRFSLRRNGRMSSRLQCLCSIEKEFIASIKDFNPRVIDNFAMRHDRQSELLHK